MSKKLLVALSMLGLFLSQDIFAAEPIPKCPDFICYPAESSSRLVLKFQKELTDEEKEDVIKSLTMMGIRHAGLGNTVGRIYTVNFPLIVCGSERKKYYTGADITYLMNQIHSKLKNLDKVSFEGIGEISIQPE